MLLIFPNYAEIIRITVKLFRFTISRRAVIGKIVNFYDKNLKTRHTAIITKTIISGYGAKSNSISVDKLYRNITGVFDFPILLPLIYVLRRSCFRILTEIKFGPAPYPEMIASVTL